MKLQKNKFYVLLAIMLAVTMTLSGCGQAKDGNENAGNNGNKGANNDNQGAGEEAKPIKVAMVTDTGGVNDNSFNESAWDGLSRLKKDTGSTVDYLQSTTDAEYVPNLNQFVRNGWDLTWGIGFMMADSIQQVAQQNPDANLALLDAVVEAPNVHSVTFKEDEGAFLVGAVAGLMTKSNKIGFVGGAQIPVIKRFELGFIAGVKQVNPNAKVTINYVGKFDAPDQGKAAAATIYNAGADIIFHAAGATGDGVFNEAKGRKKRGEQVWVIGVDKDQAKRFGHDITLTSMIKKVEEAVYLESMALAKGEFKGGEVRVLGLSDNGVGLPDETPNLTKEVLDKVDELRQKIIAGEIKIPTE